MVTGLGAGDANLIPESCLPITGGQCSSRGTRMCKGSGVGKRCGVPEVREDSSKNVVKRAVGRCC